jgi:ABC-type dipeptide/oligopeptide/nickel transport system permease component
MGILLLSSTMIVFGNLLADIAYGFLDPKITFQWKAMT